PARDAPRAPARSLRLAVPRRGRPALRPRRARARLSCEVLSLARPNWQTHRSRPLETEMTTKFQVRHVFPFPPETFWTRVHANTEFNRALYNEHLGHRYDILVNDEASGKWLSRMYPKV